MQLHNLYFLLLNYRFLLPEAVDVLVIAHNFNRNPQNALAFFPSDDIMQPYIFLNQLRGWVEHIAKADEYIFVEYCVLQ